MCCPETVTVNLKAVNWLKEKYPELCIKAGLCERIGGRLYTKTLYTTPQQRKPLTDEQIERIWESLPFCNGAWETFARAIEAAHGIKG